ncbi:hypothetical protein HXX76_002852 [Chlamydomonas incerta]|uniref:Uncharacterized protein n=1 Tax=Chlamydomonas incerta TaxID=51695 RepID=A0A835TFH4_CHLIN|nr:hypothetical protein HXX76_002852 [Chlamydomonas incerta]|eukprot:KAG2442772.1 hypothetical protein HXX76_002852 [Chlamydomonas incerta]
MSSTHESAVAVPPETPAQSFGEPPAVASAPSMPVAPAPATPEAAEAVAAAPEAAAPVKKLKATASGPSGGYISEKLAVFARAVRRLWKDAKETGKRYRAEPGDAGKKAAARGAGAGPATTAAEGQPEQGTAAAAALGAPPSQSAPAAAPTLTAGGANPVQRVVEAGRTHEPADQLQTQLSPAHKLANAVVSTIEHVADEAAAVQAGLAAGVREELDKLTHDSHEAQQAHPQPLVPSPAAAAAALAQPLAGGAGAIPAGTHV